jgi:autotransporter-associated beta strand protein
MKTKLQLPHGAGRGILTIGGLMPLITGLLVATLPTAQAANVFWDSNGSTAGAGDPATGNWGVDSFWNTDTTGGAGTFTTAVGSANDAFFSAGSDAVSAFTVTVSGTNAANSLSFQEGIPTLNGGVIALTKATVSSGVIGSLGAATTLAGTATVNSGINIDATGSGNPLLKLIVNDGAGDPDLTLTGVITRLGANTFGVRPGGAGRTRITSSLAAINGTIEGLAASPFWIAPVTIAGNQTLTASIFFRSGTTHGAGAQLILGDGPSDIQSWAGLTVDNATPTVAVVIRSTATMSGSLALSRSAVHIPGTLNCAGTLTVGGSAAAGTLQLSDGLTSGSASFGGLSVGAFLGSVISGGSAGMSKLTLSNNSAATVTANLSITDNVQFNKRGAGTLTLGGSHSYVGATTVGGGRLDLTGTIVSSVTVSNGASIGGEGSTTANVTFTSGAQSLFADPVSPGVLTASAFDASAATVIVNPSSASSGVVLQATTPNGIIGVVGVNYIAGGRGTLSTNVTGDQLIYTSAPGASLTWKGASPLNPTFWDVFATTNWLNGGSADYFFSGDNVRFDDSASTFTVAIQSGSASPGNVVISNNANAYTISNGSIIGAGSVTKSGSSSATIVTGGHAFTGGLTVNDGTLNLLGAANTFTGGVTNNGGLLVISNINQIGATGGGSSLNSINLNGGTVSYIGPTITSDTLIVNLLGGTSTIDVTVTNTTLRTGAAVTGAGDLIKSGLGTLALGKNNVQTPLGNTFTGKITVTGGQLDIRQNDSMGDISGITELINGTLYLDPFGQPSGMTFDAEPVVCSGNSFIRNFNQGTTIPQVNVLTGPMTNNGTLGIFSQTNGGAYGELQITGNIVNGPGSALNFGANNANVPLSQNQFVTVSGTISGPASVSAQGGSAATYTLANNNYTGNTTVNSGKLIIQQPSLGSASTVKVATGGLLQLDFGAVTNTIGSLVLGGIGQAPGVYSSNTHPAFLAGEGSLLVTTLWIADYSTNITSSLSGSTLSLSWPATHLGWILQGQTNNLTTGITTTWSDIPGTAAVIATNLTIDPANPTVFFRLRYP